MIPLKPYIQPATMCHPQLNSLYTQLGSSCNKGMKAKQDSFCTFDAESFHSRKLVSEEAGPTNEFIAHNVRQHQTRSLISKTSFKEHMFQRAHSLKSIKGPLENILQSTSPVIS